jgi:hypothetical protein
MMNAAMVLCFENHDVKGNASKMELRSGENATASLLHHVKPTQHRIHWVSSLTLFE